MTRATAAARYQGPLILVCHGPEDLDPAVSSVTPTLGDVPPDQAVALASAVTAHRPVRVLSSDSPAAVRAARMIGERVLVAPVLDERLRKPDHEAWSSFCEAEPGEESGEVTGTVGAAQNALLDLRAGVKERPYERLSFALLEYGWEDKLQGAVIVAHARVVWAAVSMLVAGEVSMLVAGEGLRPKTPPRPWSYCVLLPRGGGCHREWSLGEYGLLLRS